MTVRWTVRAAPGPPAGGESLIARHVVADFTCSRRRFLFLKKRATPVAVPAFFGARSARLKNSTAATRSPPFSHHRRPLARLPFPAASGLSPCGRRSLSLFSDARFARKRSRTFPSEGAPRAPTSIPYSSFLIALFSPPRLSHRTKAPLSKGAVTGGDWGIVFSPSPRLISSHQGPLVKGERPARRRGIPYSAPRRRGLHLFATTFFVSQKTRHLCCGTRLFRRSQCSLEKFDRGHSLASLFPPPAAVGSRPRSVAPPLRRKDRSRRLGAFALRAAFSFSFLRCSLRSQKVKDFSIRRRASAPTLIPHFSFLIALSPPGSLFSCQKESSF